MSIETPDLANVSTNSSHETVGEYLQKARQARGMTLSDVSDVIKYNVHQLAALEEHKWSALPSGFVLRSIVKQYAIAVGADPEIALSKLAGETNNSAPSTRRNIAARFDTPINEQYEEGSSWVWWLKIIIFTLIAIAIVYVLVVQDTWLADMMAFFRKWFPQ
ncbi:helix-turn-helix domain-containing protein [Pelistega ratti]|uniref:helix-turn-helix domain-containing protein n=1 Tax=Pelistega ratti TaxID=2652177 RepID=UPI001358E47C|nr:helix-turn-helix domain-containing protein [Pelistega ratti]